MSTLTTHDGEPTYGVVSPETLKSMTGVAFLTAIKDGALPAAPITQTLNFELSEVAEGRVVFTGTPRWEHYNPIGSVHGGWFATLLDSCMGCAIHSSLAKGIGYTTLEFKVNLLRAMTKDTGRVQAEGVVVQSGQRVGVAEGRLTDSAGRLLAHGTTTCLIFPL